MNEAHTRPAGPHGHSRLRASLRGCAAALIGASLLAACGVDTPSTGSIGGTVSVANAPAATRATAAPGVAPGAFVPGEVVVKFRPGVRAQSMTALSAGGVSFQRVRALGNADTALFRAGANASATSAAVRELAARPDVEYAQPNYLQSALATPNDPGFSSQWHLRALNLPAAWDAEKGLNRAVTVAVIDTGVLTGHPDLQGKLLPGYDFITDPRNANDGDGRDADPNDPGDTPGGQSSYHGSHVAGTVAAATNNGVGVSGVSWGAKILPVRVLGTQGGTTTDITDAMLWAAGLPVAGVPNNPNPAKVINMSLGGELTCAQVPLYQDTINRVVATGAIVVVAAGNSNKDASGFVPAGCSGVITVGATGPSGARASYSNYGARVDVMATGGDMQTAVEEGILSLGRDDARQQFGYVWENGTSMATPHVAGILALMAARDPGLTGVRALDLLKRTATPLTGPQCVAGNTAVTAAGCGAGLVNASTVIAQLDGSTTTPDFSVAVAPTSLTVRPGASASASVSVVRSGGLTFSSEPTVSVTGVPAGVSTNVTGSAAAGYSVTVNVAASVAAGSYPLVVKVTGGGLTRQASLTVVTGAATSVSVKDTYVFACAYDAAADDCDLDRSWVIKLTADRANDTYLFDDLPTDTGYLMFAWKDVDGNEKIEEGDYLGLYLQNGDWPLVRATRSGVDIALEPIQGTTALPGGHGAALARSLEAIVRR
ncbi:S8 family serine peptidase [Deinococcus pimensis]|uniref:S8 family serine peptidase n=1 Tax=Deinococcus pimensis TaxID=309888 RepID=UPI0004BBAEC9|nr:S8 family serine peptidase [Deinococcus pimensis]